MDKSDERLFWTKDQGIGQLLRALWQDDEENNIERNKVSHPKLLLTWQHFENIILSECRKVLDIDYEESILSDEVIRNTTKYPIGFRAN